MAWRLVLVVLGFFAAAGADEKDVLKKALVAKKTFKSDDVFMFFPMFCLLVLLKVFFSTI